MPLALLKAEVGARVVIAIGDIEDAGGVVELVLGLAGICSDYENELYQHL